MTELVKREPEAIDLKLQDKEYLQLIRDTYAKDFTELEFRLAIEAARRLRLDPVANQITFAKIQGRLVNIVRIDGFRLQAERSGKYAGQAPPQWCGQDGTWVDVWLDDGPPAAARVAIHRTDFKEPIVAVARFRSYAKGSPNWRMMPDVMIAKCAEALAIRKAFPQETASIYADAEIDRVRQPAPLPEQVDAEPESDAQTKRWDAFCDMVKAAKTEQALQDLVSVAKCLHDSYRSQARAIWSNRLEQIKLAQDEPPPDLEPEILPGEPEPISDETQQAWGFSDSD